MKIKRIIPGQYSEIWLEDGKRIFFSVLNDRISVYKMFLFIPIKKVWEFIFPFYIRTADEAWESSEKILQITVDSVADVNNLSDLVVVFETETSKALRNFISEHGDKSRDISVEKVGIHAIKRMLNPKELKEIETIVHKYGKVVETTCRDAKVKFPAFTFPESLLPYPKKRIEKALNDAIRYIDDGDMVRAIQASAPLLECFINDEEANKKNEEMRKNLNKKML